MNKRTKKIILEGIIAVLLVVVFIVVNKLIDKNKAEKCEVRDGGGLNICIEDMSKENGLVSLSGWCFRPGMNTLELKDSTRIEVILMNSEDNSEKYFLNTDVIIRNDINDLFPLDNSDYSYSGFETTVKESKLELDKKNYDILFYYINWGGEAGLFGYRSGYRIVNGELVKE